jgi:hypothetical protein
MKYLRWFLGVVIIGWAGINLLPICTTVAYKLFRPASPTGDELRMVPPMEPTSWLQLAAWILAFLLLLLAAWRLFKGGKAFAPYIVATLISLANWGYMKMGPVYDSVFTEQELQFAYVIFAVELIVAVLLWWIEHQKGTSAVAA